MAFTKVDIISQASFVLGNGAINDINSNLPFIKNAVAAYDLIVESVLAKHNWRFATRTQQLNVLIDEPILKEWRFILELPADYLAMDRIEPNVNFEIFENKHLFTNEDNIIIVYRFLPDVSRFPSYFVEYLVYAIAKQLAISVAQKESFDRIYDEERQRTLATGLFADAQSHPNRRMADAPFISVRRGGRQITSIR